ncbi:uncharacterized protein Z518_07998 [Rhinocladiella mackenziei CBS 650.93]|uniref:Low temperature requirement protein A n=1 Tax=Rhinocladiella mackenziei CBS 650.93 TaxID=1442369 RepID=A0A0D2I890_9EURO|nr:uncharacterized protein Z518_07998 [Rhinocladiella mackenziei CBS 650.93]KIX02059.1 hypothetical protein Z518_07998 [Rhinocladiella mackenziei CBS 650.93]
MTELKERRYLIRRPQALQYFYRGELKKLQEKERVAGRFELFLDLLCMYVPIVSAVSLSVSKGLKLKVDINLLQFIVDVAIIANFSDSLAEDATPQNLVKFILIFAPAWHAWADAKENANNYYNDDVLQRVGVLWVMALLVVYGNNANLVTEDIGAIRLTVATYMVLRFSQICLYALYSIASHHHRTQNRAYFLAILVGLCIWIPLLFESISLRTKIAVAVVGIVYEEFCYVLTFGPWLARWLKLDYSTAVDIDHENDRYTAFTILVLGEFTYAILVGSPAAGALTLKTLRAVETLIIAFCFNSMYVYCDGATESVHPIRRAVWSSFSWLLIHLPLSAGLMLGGHISAATVPEERLNSGQRWLWGGGLGLGTFCLFLIALLYKDDDPKGFLRFSKPVRLFPRLLVSITFVLLPLTSEEQLDATHLVSVGAGLMVLVVAWETVGSLEKDACLFESWNLTRDDADSSEDGEEVEILRGETTATREGESDARPGLDRHYGTY